MNGVNGGWSGNVCQWCTLEQVIMEGLAYEWERKRFIDEMVEVIEECKSGEVGMKKGDCSISTMIGFKCRDEIEGK